MEGALSGAVAGTGLRILWQAGLNSIISGGVNTIKQIRNANDFSVIEVVKSAAVGAGAGFIGGAGALISGELAGIKIAQSFAKVFFYNRTNVQN